MAQVQLGQLVVGEIQRFEAGLPEAPGKLCRLAAATDLDPYIDMGAVAICNAVIEFGDVARTEHPAERQEGPRPFRNGDGKHRLARFADLGTLGHEAQPVEVHVGAAGHGHQ